MKLTLSKPCFAAIMPCKEIVVIPIQHDGNGDYGFNEVSAMFDAFMGAIDRFMPGGSFQLVASYFADADPVSCHEALALVEAARTYVKALADWRKAAGIGT